VLGAHACHFSLRACFFLAFVAVVVLVVSPAAAPSPSLSCTASATSSAATGVCNLARRRVSNTASYSDRITHFQECDVRAHTPSSAFWSRQQLEVAFSRSQWPPLNSPPLQLLAPEQPSVRALWLPRLEAAACASSSQAAPTSLILRRCRGEAIEQRQGQKSIGPLGQVSTADNHPS
jgi:hypothetical protein